MIADSSLTNQDFYFHAANGDQEAADFYLKQVVDSLHRPIDDPQANYSKGIQTVKLLLSLSKEFQNRDNTRAGIAKAAVLSDLALREFAKLHWASEDDDPHHYSYQFKDKEERELHHHLTFYSKYANQRYLQMHVSSHLPEDNMWKAAYKKIKT